MRRQGVVGFAALGAVGIAAVALGWLRCPLAALYHIPCPGCGMTRAIVLLSTGHVRESLRMNALALPALAASVALAAALLSTDPQTDPRAAARLRARIVMGVMVSAAATLLWALRWLGLFGGPVPV